ncbi:MAG: hypothetical protein J7J01_00130, partial [Methanophagales archaeon]|nr:hypothetical protein [Methanophagales archaeon]
LITKVISPSKHIASITTFQHRYSFTFDRLEADMTIFCEWLEEGVKKHRDRRQVKWHLSGCLYPTYPT